MFAGWGVTNEGQNSVCANWIDRLSLSNGITNLVFQFPGFHSAPNGAGYLNSLDMTLPPIPAGTYSLIAETDINNDVVETNENNNRRAISVMVTNLPPSAVLLGPTNNLSVTSCVPVAFRFAGSATPGSYTITNVGIYDGQTLLAQTNRAPFLFKKIYLPQGEHTITSQALDNFGLRGLSTAVTISVRWPAEMHRFIVNLNTNGDCVACMLALPGSNYVVETTTNLRPPIGWVPYQTNQPIGSILIFTNRPADPQRFFRAKIWP